MKPINVIELLGLILTATSVFLFNIPVDGADFYGSLVGVFSAIAWIIVAVKYDIFYLWMLNVGLLLFNAVGIFI